MTFVIRKTPTEVKLERFSTLQQGWHYGAGEPISEGVIASAKDVYEQLLLHGLTRTDVFAGANGEVQLTAYRGEHLIAVTIEPTGDYTLVHEVAGKDEAGCYEDELTSDRLKQRLGEVAQEAWPTSDWSTRTTSILQHAVLVTSPSSGLLTAAACQSSSSGAPRILAA